MNVERAPLGVRNPQIAKLRRLIRRRSDRERTATFVLEGPTLVLDALATTQAVREVYVDVSVHGELDDVRRAAARAGCKVHEVASGVLDGVSDVRHGRPVLAVVERPDASLGEVIRRAAPASPLLVLDGISDPGNAGTLLRSAEAAGIAAVVATAGTVDLYSPKVVRSAAGSVLRLPLACGVDPAEVAQLADHGLRIVGTRAQATAYDVAEFSGAVALVLGSEAHGVSEEIAELVEVWVGIPMAGAAESINVAVAGSVLLFDMARRRRVTSSGEPGAMS